MTDSVLKIVRWGPWLLAVGVSLAWLTALAGGQSLPPRPVESLPPPAESLPPPYESLAVPPAADPVPPDEPQVVEVRILGNRGISSSRITGKLMTRAGRPYDSDLVQTDVRTLFHLGWFSHVEPRYEDTPQGRIVIFKVTERPTIRYIQFLGAKKIKPKTLEKQLGIKRGETIDPYRVEEGRHKIEDYYHENGYNRVQVLVEEGDSIDDHGVIYVITEGPSQKVWSVKFEGNKFVSDRRLKTQIQSKPGFMKYFKGYVDPKKIEADQKHLEAYYRAFGFFQAKVGRVLEFDDNGKWLTLRFIIHEGQRYSVRRVSFLGNQRFASEDLGKTLKLQSGQPFDQIKMDHDRKWLQQLYGSQGLVFADIRAEMKFHEEPGTIDLVYKIEEGKQWRVGRIFVHIDGPNPHTQIQTVLNRLSLQPGDVMDIRELEASERRLQHSRLFRHEPARGVSPKIVYRIPELHDEAIAEGPPSKFRGQSPDGRPAGQPVRRRAYRPTVGEAVVDLHIYGEAVEAAAPAPGPNAAGATQNPSANAPGANAPGASLRSNPGHRPLQPGDVMDIRELEASERRLQHSRLFRHEPARGVSPTIVYQIPELHGEALAKGPPSTFRGQSPYGKPAIQPVRPTPRRHAVRKPPIDGRPTAHTAWRARTDAERSREPTDRPVLPAYRNLFADRNRPSQNQSPPRARNPRSVVRGQNPVYPSTPYPAAPYPTRQVSAPAGATPPPDTRYGGQPVGATGPDSNRSVATSPAVPPSAVRVAQAEQPAFNPVVPLSPSQPQTYPQPPPWQLFPQQPGIMPGPLADPTVDIFIDAEETETGRFMAGASVNSDLGLFGNIVVEEQNFNIWRWPRSWEDIRNGTAWRGAGQRFRLEASPGSEVQRYIVSLQDPFFTPTISLGMSGSFYDRRYVDWDEQRIGGRVSIGRQWTERDIALTFAYRGENVNIHDPAFPTPPELAEVVGDNSLHGFRVAATNDTRDSAFLATSGHFIQMSFEQVIGTFDYPRAILDARQYYLLHERPDRSGRHVLGYATRLGFTGSHTPVYEHFFAGGTSTMRGFDFRGASPVDGIVRVGGEFMWINTLEYLFPISADDMIRGVVFTDFGTVERNVTIKDFRASPGFGLRIVVPAMGPAPIALDFAWPIVRADTDDQEVFSFSVGLQR